ncbi:MAG: hypothetical protein IKU37_04100 [Candidatus Gastranaerophilales bacterium]|nr:hypothetical protein [Candidatus Gastranaerophilales bacterium]
MQINNIQYTPKQNGFTGKINHKKMADIAKETLNLPEESLINIEDYRNYFVPIRYKAKMDTKELKQLFSINEEANSIYFLNECYQYFKKQLNIPEEIAPTFSSIAQNTPFLYAYDFITNTVVKNMAFYNADLSKNDVFVYLRHEFQHYLQNMEIYRHETLGKEWLEHNITTFVQKDKEDLKDFLTTKPVEEWGSDINTLRFYYTLRECLRNNDEDLFNKLYQPYENGIRQSLTAFRERIIKAKGMIPKNHKLTERIKNYMEGFKATMQYCESSGAIKMNEYKTNFNEGEAFAVQLNTLDEIEAIV